MTDVVYGFPCVENPNDFTPDEEVCTPVEIAAHKQACADWDAGTYQRDPSKFCQTNSAPGILHITRTPWGLGINTFECSEDGDE